VTTAPFEIRLLPEEGRIVLGGTMDGSPEVYAEIEEVAKQAQSQEKWIVDATEVLLKSWGTVGWIQAVHKYLRNCQLTYVQCQLLAVLQNIEEATHRQEEGKT